MDSLRAAYLEVMMEEPGTSLDAFMGRVVQGDFGARSSGEIAAFLRSVERDTLASIETQAASTPGLADELEERREEVRAEFEALLRRHAAPPAV